MSLQTLPEAFRGIYESLKVQYPNYIISWDGQQFTFDPNPLVEPPESIPSKASLVFNAELNDFVKLQNNEVSQKVQAANAEAYKMASSMLEQDKMEFQSYLTNAMDDEQKLIEQLALKKLELENNMRVSDIPAIENEIAAISAKLGTLREEMEEAQSVLLQSINAQVNIEIKRFKANREANLQAQLNQIAIKKKEVKEEIIVEAAIISQNELKRREQEAARLQEQMKLAQIADEIDAENRERIKELKAIINTRIIESKLENFNRESVRIIAGEEDESNRVSRYQVYDEFLKLTKYDFVEGYDPVATLSVDEIESVMQSGDYKSYSECIKDFRKNFLAFSSVPNVVKEFAALLAQNFELDANKLTYDAIDTYIDESIEFWSWRIQSTEIKDIIAEREKQLDEFEAQMKEIEAKSGEQVTMRALIKTGAGYQYETKSGRNLFVEYSQYSKVMVEVMKNIVNILYYAKEFVPAGESSRYFKGMTNESTEAPLEIQFIYASYYYSWSINKRYVETNNYPAGIIRPSYFIDPYVNGDENVVTIYNNVPAGEIFKMVEDMISEDMWEIFYFYFTNFFLFDDSVALDKEVVSEVIAELSDAISLSTHKFSPSTLFSLFFIAPEMRGYYASSIKEKLGVNELEYQLIAAAYDKFHQKLIVDRNFVVNLGSFSKYYDVYINPIKDVSPWDSEPNPFKVPRYVSLLRDFNARKNQIEAEMAERLTLIKTAQEQQRSQFIPEKYQSSINKLPVNAMPPAGGSMMYSEKDLEGIYADAEILKVDEDAFPLQEYSNYRNYLRGLLDGSYQFFEVAQGEFYYRKQLFGLSFVPDEQVSAIKSSIETYRNSFESFKSLYEGFYEKEFVVDESIANLDNSFNLLSDLVPSLLSGEFTFSEWNTYRLADNYKVIYPELFMHDSVACVYALNFYYALTKLETMNYTAHFNRPNYMKFFNEILNKAKRQNPSFFYDELNIHSNPTELYSYYTSLPMYQQRATYYDIKNVLESRDKYVAEDITKVLDYLFISHHLFTLEGYVTNPKDSYQLTIVPHEIFNRLLAKCKQAFVDFEYYEPDFTGMSAADITRVAVQNPEIKTNFNSNLINTFNSLRAEYLQSIVYVDAFDATKYISNFYRLFLQYQNKMEADGIKEARKLYILCNVYDLDSPRAEIEDIDNKIDLMNKGEYFVKRINMTVSDPMYAFESDVMIDFPQYLFKEVTDFKSSFNGNYQLVGKNYFTWDGPIAISDTMDGFNFFSPFKIFENAVRVVRDSVNKAIYRLKNIHNLKDGLKALVAVTTVISPVGLGTQVALNEVSNFISGMPVEVIPPDLRPAVAAIGKISSVTVEMLRGELTAANLKAFAKSFLTISAMSMRPLTAISKTLAEQAMKSSLVRKLDSASGGLLTSYHNLTVANINLSKGRSISFKQVLFDAIKIGLAVYAGASVLASKALLQTVTEELPIGDKKLLNRVIQAGYAITTGQVAADDIIRQELDAEIKNYILEKTTKQGTVLAMIAYRVAGPLASTERPFVERLVDIAYEESEKYIRYETDQEIQEFMSRNSEYMKYIQATINIYQEYSKFQERGLESYKQELIDKKDKIIQDAQNKAQEEYEEAMRKAQELQDEILKVTDEQYIQEQIKKEQEKVIDRLEEQKQKVEEDIKKVQDQILDAQKQEEIIKEKVEEATTKAQEDISKEIEKAVERDYEKAISEEYDRFSEKIENEWERFQQENIGENIEEEWERFKNDAKDEWERVQDRIDEEYDRVTERDYEEKIDKELDRFKDDIDEEWERFKNGGWKDFLDDLKDYFINKYGQIPDQVDESDYWKWKFDYNEPKQKTVPWPAIFAIGGILLGTTVILTSGDD